MSECVSEGIAGQASKSSQKGYTFLGANLSKRVVRAVLGFEKGTKVSLEHLELGLKEGVSLGIEGISERKGDRGPAIQLILSIPRHSRLLGF